MLFIFFNASVNKASVAAYDSCFSALMPNTYYFYLTTLAKDKAKATAHSQYRLPYDRHL